MNKRQYNKLTMIYGVQAYLNESQTAWSDLPVIGEKVSKLREIQEAITSNNEFQLHVTGISGPEKLNARKNAEASCIKLSGALYDFGMKTSSAELTRLYDVTPSDVMKWRDVNLVIFLNSLKEDVRNNLGSLAPYGISEAILEEHSGNFNRYFETIGKKESSTARRKSANKAIAQAFRDADETLRSLDKLMEHFRVSDTNLYNGYKSSRSIWDRGIRKKKLPDEVQTLNTQ